MRIVIKKMNLIKLMDTDGGDAFWYKDTLYMAGTNEVGGEVSCMDLSSGDMIDLDKNKMIELAKVKVVGDGS